MQLETMCECPNNCCKTVRLKGISFSRSGEKECLLLMLQLLNVPTYHAENVPS